MGEPQLAIRHFGHTIHTSIEFFEKISAARTPEEPRLSPFKELNDYFSSNGFLQMQLGDRVYGAYRDIYATLSAHHEPAELTYALQPRIAQLYEALDLSGMSSFIRDVYCNPDIEPLEQAVRVLSFQLRPMLPVWNEYIQRTGKAWGTVFTEMRAIDLLKDTSLVTTTGYQAMQDYMRKVVDHRGDAPAPKSIVGSMNTNDFIAWMFSQVTVRRLATADLDPQVPGMTTLASVYRYTRQRALGHVFHAPRG